MNSLYANVLNETEKLWKRRGTKGFLLLTIVIPMLTAIILIFLQNNIAGVGSNLPLQMLRLFTFAIFPIFLFMSASESFAGELASRTIKLGLVRPITRAKVFASKVVAMAISIAVLLGMLLIMSISLEWAVTRGNSTNGLLNIITAYVVAFVPMLAIGLISVFIAQFFKTSNGAMVLIMLIYAAAKLLPFFFPPISVWSIFSYTDWYVLWLGNGAPLAKLSNTFILLLSYCLMAYSAGLILFEKKQF